MSEDNDPRSEELSSLSAIFPEIQFPNPKDQYTIALELPVTPSDPVTVFFPAVADNSAANGENGQKTAGPVQPPVIDSHKVAHFPPLRLEITFGPKYPDEEPPKASISTSPPWLPDSTIKRLENDATRIWEETGMDIAGYAYIDHIQQATSNVFGLVDDSGTLMVDSSHKIAILDYDIQARQAKFDRGTYECGVCLEPKKGSVCHKMLDCEHIFCVQCLRDYFIAAIKEGNIAMIRCPSPGCPKDREKKAAAEALESGKKPKKVRVDINPSELLQIPIEQEFVKRYVNLKYKLELEADRNTIYCPRSWCSGAARSKKHRKPQGLELPETIDDSDEENQSPNGNDKGKEKDKSKLHKPSESLLAICEDCSFAFCSRCFQSWHGEYYYCVPPNEKGKPTAEELATMEYLRYYTTRCPTCDVPAQKTHGCNHMICARCETHFCYLCAAWLPPENPYQHFNEDNQGNRTACYGRLWELELGDGTDAQPVYYIEDELIENEFEIPEPAPVPRQQQQQQRQQQPVPVIQQPRNRNRVPDPPPQDAPAEPAAPPAVAREGPLVLRIEANPPAAAARAPQLAAAPAPAPAGPARRGGRGGGARGRGGGGGGGPVRGGGGRGRGGAAGARGRGGGGGDRNYLGPLPRVQGRAGHWELQPQEEEWVRQFVRLALDDREEELFEEWEDPEADI